VVALLHLVFGAEDLLSESLADVSSFTGKHILKRFLLRSQGLNLLLIEVQLLIHATNGLLQGVDFTLQGG
jgi:hypothetical protein